MKLPRSRFLGRPLLQLDPPPIVVSPLWVEESVVAKRRLMERKFLVPRPKESLLGGTPGSGPGPQPAPALPGSALWQNGP